MPKFSVIVPVYNRADEINELLTSLTEQTFKDFEVIIVEDGSEDKCETIVDQYHGKLSVRYFFKENSGQGFTRNYGFSKATGEYLIVFDSDCLIPPDYFQIISDYLEINDVDAFGGPDAAHPSFTVIQKAISQSMTSFFTTGGIRGRKKHLGAFHPRSFNMGMKREVYEKTKGYIISFMGEDLEFSVRIIKEGFETALIEKAKVYHKRRTDIMRFFRQLKYFGRARVNLSRFHSGQIKLIHLFPTFFLLGLLASILIWLVDVRIGLIAISIYALYFIIVFVEALFVTRSFSVAIVVPVTSFLQLTGYGYGLIYEWLRKIRGINPNTRYTELY